MARRDRLVSRREGAGFTQESLAARLGVERSTVARWETGLSRPRRWVRDGLAGLLGVSLTELDDLFDDAVPAVPSTCSPTAPDEGGDPTDRREAMVAITTVSAGLIEQAASTAMEWTRRAEVTEVGPQTVEHLELAVSGMAAAYQFTAPAELFSRVWAYRRRVAELLDGRVTLRQRAALYRVAGRLSILLGWLSHDLGDPLAAEAHCLDAWEHGWQAEDGEVCGWAMDTAASIAMYGHRPDRALAATERGLAYAPTRTPVAVRLACQLTRVYGRLGDLKRFDRALASTSDQLDQLGDRGHGLFSVDAGRVASYAATSSIWLDRPTDAVRYATDALGYYTTSAPADQSPTREAIARLDLGLALIATRAPDGAAETTRLALASDRITDAVLTRAGDVDAALLRAYPELPETRDVHDTYLGLVDRRRAGRELTA